MSIRELDTVPLCVTLTLRYCYTGQPEELAEGESGIAEEVVDAEQFWKGTGFGVFSLGFEDRIAEPGMATAYKLFQKSLVVAVGWAIEAQPARREGRDRTLVPCFHELLGERVEVREMEKPIVAKRSHGFVALLA